MSKYAFGIDLGGTTVKIGLFSGEGYLLESWEIKTRTEDGGKNILPDIAESVLAKMAEKNIAVDDVLGAGIGVPGPVHDERVVNACVNLNWGVVDVGGILSGLLGGIKVKACNDANAAALGEYWKGGGRGYKSIVMITLGTGVGGGLITDGRIYAGATGSAVEIGHICVNPNETVVCNCGNRGCLEQYASANGIVRVAHEYLKRNKAVTILKDDDTLDCRQIFDAARADDCAGIALVEAMGDKLGMGLATAAALLNPEVFVIGGGVSKAGQIVIDTIQKYFLKYTFHACSTTGFRLAELGNSAGMYGAVKMVLSDGKGKKKK